MSNSRVLFGFTVEKGVPVPPVTTRQGHNIALLKALMPGESIYFDAPIADRAVRFYRVAKRLGVRVMIRKDAGGMRLWRLPDEAEEKGPRRRATDGKKIIKAIAANSKGRPMFTAKGHAKRQATKGARVTA